MSRAMQEKADLVLGYAATGIGATGAAFQLWGEVGSALVIGLNVILAGGGIYLLKLRITQAHHDRDKRRAETERDEPEG
jgi:hypothetical protein